MCINPKWCRVKGKTDREDKKAQHAAAMIPIDAVNKGTENLAKTAKKALITTHCTSLCKGPDCKGYCYATKLLPERIMQKNQWTQKEEAVGIEESCVNCYNRKHGTEYKEKAFERLAKETRFKIFNRVGKEVNLDEMKRIGKLQYNKFMLQERQDRREEGFEGEDIRTGPVPHINKVLL